MLSPVLVPAAKTYLKKERTARFFGLSLKIPSGTFHPTLFFSTKTMGKYLQDLPLRNKKILEIGCGSGALSILAAKKEGQVFCCDIQPEAVRSTLANAKRNQVEVKAVLSDLFTDITEKEFDLIINNPPFYPKDPSIPEEHAWYAGKHYEYFQQLFKEAPGYLTKAGEILLVLSDECNVELIHQIAKENRFDHQVVYTRNTWLEKTYIIRYKIPI